MTTNARQPYDTSFRRNGARYTWTRFYDQGPDFAALDSRYVVLREYPDAEDIQTRPHTEHDDPDNVGYCALCGARMETP